MHPTRHQHPPSSSARLFACSCQHRICPRSQRGLATEREQGAELKPYPAPIERCRRCGGSAVASSSAGASCSRTHYASFHASDPWPLHGGARMQKPLLAAPPPSPERSLSYTHTARSSGVAGKCSSDATTCSCL